MEIAELISEEQCQQAYEILCHMYPDLTLEHYKEIIDYKLKTGYHILGVYDGNKMICAAGFWLGMRFYCNKFLQLDNMVTLPEYRGKKAGKMVVDWIKKYAKQEKCERILIDTYVENFDAHRFFYREGFIIRGYHLNYTL